MKNLLDAGVVEELLSRLERLTPTSPARWGRMTVAQMLAHCSGFLEVAVGEAQPPQWWLGRILGGFLKSRYLDDSATPHNRLTVPSFRITAPKRFDEEQARLSRLLKRFAGGGAERVTTHPHPFFGVMTPREWGLQLYKHVSYHLEQFGV
jgi:DinB superfamily